jgi:hypothetical protein
MRFRGANNIDITPLFLKQQVALFLINHKAYLTKLLEDATSKMTIMNTELDNQLDTDINTYQISSSTLVDKTDVTNTNINYISLYDTAVDKIFSYYYSFGVIKPKSLSQMTPDEQTNRGSPFTVVSNDNKDIEKYIESNSYLFPSNEAIISLNNILKLGIIVVSRKSEAINEGEQNSLLINMINTNEPTDTNDTINTFSFYNQSQTSMSNLNYGEWNKFLFLYKETTPGQSFGNYGIITFTYSLKPITINGSQLISKTGSFFRFTIFNKDDMQFSPPIYMLYTIFYLIYIGQGKYTNFVFYPEIMKGFYQTFNALIEKSKETQNWTYFNNVYSWFKTPALKQILMSNKYDTVNGYIKGGARNNYNRNYNSNSNYNRNYNSNSNYNSFLKNEGVKDLSKICYSVSLDLELKRGSPLTPDELKQSNCTQKWNTIRKSFANFTDKKYNIPPVYDYSNKQTLKNKSNNTNTNNNNNNITRKNGPNTFVSSGGTRKHKEIKKVYLGKHGKTIRKL